MGKAETSYHVLLKKSAAVKIAGVLVFAMFLNMLNLGVFVSLRDFVMLNISAPQVENDLGRICGVVNFPIKIVNDIFKKDREMSGSKEDKNKNADSKLFALLIPVKQTKKAESVLQPEALAPFTGGKVLFKPVLAVLSDLSSKYCGMIRYLEGIDIVRCMLLLLMIMLLLPRGIPVKVKNLINIIFVFPVFILGKDGVFNFITGCKRGSM